MSDSDDETNIPSASVSAPSGSASSSSSTVPTQMSSSQVHEYVMKFLKNMQPRHIKSQQKKHIRSFAQFYFHKKPVINERDIILLLCGEGEKFKGLIDSCGNTNLKTIRDIKASSVLALELVCMLLDPSINKHQWHDFQEVMRSRLDIKYLQAMKLDRHILSQQGNHDYVFNLVSWFEEHMPNIKKQEYIQNQEALEAYEKWQEENKQSEGEEEVETGPITWAQAVLMRKNGRSAAAQGSAARVGMKAAVVMKSHEEDDDDEYEGDEAEALEAVMQEAEKEAEEEEEHDPLGLQKIVRKDNALKKKGKGITSFFKKITNKDKSATEHNTDVTANGNANANVNTNTNANANANATSTSASQSTTSKSVQSSVGSVSASASLPSLNLLDEVIQTGSIYTSSEDFNPVLFLTTVHSRTPLSSLSNGLQTLQQSVNNRAHQIKLLVKEHFGQYVYCKDTIDDLHNNIQTELSEKHGKSGKLKIAVDDIQSMADRLYKPLLERKQHNDRIKNVLDVCARFRFLFQLPGALQEHIKTQQYDKVVRDYKKAKSLVVLGQPTSVTPSSVNFSNSSSLPPIDRSTYISDLPRRVLQEVQNIVADFRSSLLTKLENPYAPLEEQQRIIGFLLELDCTEDPAWYYLRKQKEWICSLMDKAVQEHQQRVGETGTFMAKLTGQSAASTSSQQRTSFSNPSSTVTNRPSVSDDRSSLNVRPSLHSSFSRLSSFSSSSSSSSSSLSSSIVPSLGVSEVGYAHSIAKLVRRLCVILSKTMPDFFQLAQNIDSGKFARAAKQTFAPAHTNEDIHNTNTATWTHGIEQSQRVQRLISAINLQFSNYIRLALFPPNHIYARPAYSNDSSVSASDGVKSPNPSSSGAVASLSDADDAAHLKQSTSVPSGFVAFPVSMHDNVHSVLKCVENVRDLNMPNEYARDLKQLGDDVQRYWVEHTFRNTFIAISTLYREEDWQSDPDQSSITKLPLLFEDHLTSALRALTAIPVIKSKWMVEFVATPFLECARAFTDTLHTLAFHATNTVNKDSTNSANKAAAVSSTSSSSGLSSTSSSSSSMNSLAAVVIPHSDDRRLLYVLSNTMYTTDEILPVLFTRLKSLLPASTHSLLEARMDSSVYSLFDVLEHLLFSSYVRTKTFALNEYLKRGYFMSGMNWHNVRSPLSVRSWVLELLLHLVFIHEELYSVRNSELERFMEAISERLFESLLNAVCELDTLGRTGAQQVLCEAEFMQMTLENYMTEEAEQTFKLITTRLEEIIQQQQPQQKPTINSRVNVNDDGYADEGDMYNDVDGDLLGNDNVYEDSGGGNSFLHFSGSAAVDQAKLQRISVLSRVQRSTCMMFLCFQNQSNVHQFLSHMQTQNKTAVKKQTNSNSNLNSNSNQSHNKNTINTSAIAIAADQQDEYDDDDEQFHKTPQKKKKTSTSGTSKYGNSASGGGGQMKGSKGRISEGEEEEDNG